MKNNYPQLNLLFFFLLTLESFELQESYFVTSRIFIKVVDTSIENTPINLSRLLLWTPNLNSVSYLVLPLVLNKYLHFRMLWEIIDKFLHRKKEYFTVMVCSNENRLKRALVEKTGDWKYIYFSLFMPLTCS